MATAQRVVVVGASLAGVRAAEALRAGGFDGPLTFLGDERHRPYDRPPLSKDVLAGRRPPEVVALDVHDTVEADWRLGTRAVALDLDARTVALEDGSSLGFDGLVLATGAAPRRIPGWPRSLAGLHVLRSLDDCAALRADLQAGPRRVVVVGAGFIGCEVAATSRSLGLDVTVVEPLAAPCIRGLGEEMGLVVADLHRDHGVDLRLGTVVEDLHHDGSRVTGVQLADGTDLDADVVVVGIGVSPATAWLEGSGLELRDGVVCDTTCAAAPGVVAAGDVARWDHPRYGSIRIEHWDNAIAQGGHAARTLLAHLAGGVGEPFAPVPWFWSDQFDRKLQVVGRAGPDAKVQVVDGSIEERKFVATYTEDGDVVAVLGMNMPAAVMRWRLQLGG